MISAPIKTTQVEEDEKLLGKGVSYVIEKSPTKDETEQTFKTLLSVPFSLVPKPSNIEAGVKDCHQHSKNTHDYFEIFKDKSLIKERDREIQELIDGQQLSNSTFVIEIEDFGELDSFVTLLDPITPKDIKIYTSETFPNMHTLKEKPRLMIKSFKFEFMGDNHTPSYQKHQEFINEMNLVYTKAVKHIKDSMLENYNANSEEFKSGIKSRDTSSKFMKRRAKYEEVKNELQIDVRSL